MILPGTNHKYLLKKREYTVEIMVDIKRWIFDDI